MSAEAVYTTLYLLQRGHLIGELGGRRQLTFRLTVDGARAVRTILKRGCGTDVTPASPSP